VSNRRHLVPQHPYGIRRDGVTHMCPAGCRHIVDNRSVIINPFCPTCQGRGEVTAAELARWQAAENERM
jgi:hypothetical protein